ncbi:hypothetical protein HXY32_01145 [Candidatus Bathyarchaeota archaeon]|nr:hypothetical protein [Candidatus Bathyarchaeota archaeon]
MRVPIRMIGIATTFFWIFLIAFLVTAVYSTKDVAFNFGEPQMNTNASGEIVFSLPISVANRGFYDIGAFAIMTEVFDNHDASIVRGSTLVPVIKKNDEVTVVHNMTFDMNDLLQRSENFLFNDSELKIYAAVGMRIAEVIPVEASSNFSMPWGAPLYNFTLGDPAYAPYNLTHWRATVPLSFENHAFFDLIGNVQIQMYNDAGTLVGEGQTSVEAYANSSYSGFIELYVSIVEVTSSGWFEVYFSTSIFNYGPLVISYG